MSIFSRKLTREITQIRFRPTLDWFSLRSNIAHIVEEHYEEWRSDENGNVALYSPSKKEALEVFTQHITHLREASFSGDRNLSDTSRLIATIQEKSDVTEVRRVGFRSINIYSCTFSFSEIVDLLERKLFLIRKEPDFPQSGTTTDLAFILDTVGEDNVKTHVQLGAVKKDEGIEKFGTKFDLNGNLEDDNNLFIDIDVFIETPNQPILKERLESLQESARETLTKYLNYLEEK